jgi:hypothetical protein
MKKLCVVLSLFLSITLMYGCYTTPPQERPFTMNIGVDKPTYRVGDEVVITVRTSRTCYLTLYDISTEGEVTQIFPNQFASDNLVQGGYEYRIPTQTDRFYFEISGPPGTERVRAIGTIDNVNFFEERKIDATETFPRIYQERPGQFDKELSQKLHVIPTERWTEASVTFEVVL